MATKTQEIADKAKALAKAYSTARSLARLLAPHKELSLDARALAAKLGMEASRAEMEAIDEERKPK